MKLCLRCTEQQKLNRLRELPPPAGGRMTRRYCGEQEAGLPACACGAEIASAAAPVLFAGARR